MNNGHVVVKQVICHVLLLNTSLTIEQKHILISVTSVNDLVRQRWEI